MDESKLVRLLGTSAKKETAKEMGERIPCSQFGDNDYHRYIRGEMSLQDMDLFVKHCEECQSCLKEIANRHMILTQRKEQSENNHLFTKTIEFLDHLDKEEKGIKENLFDIVIKIARKAAKIISTTGELLQPVQPLAVRAAGEKVESETWRIIQEFANPPLSVQVSGVQGETAGNISLIISLYDPDADDFLSRKKVYITASGETRETTTNDSGEVYFDINQHTTCEIAIGDKEKPDARLSINIVKE